ncbi:hypothetical protein NDA01_11470 [Trichocoleus desertorum AS-A10]|uniref:hypothetical protein n=1 Tax=Trichocoleus desertorum TaxID=1481672 RepID=UPI00329A223F
MVSLVQKTSLAVAGAAFLSIGSFAADVITSTAQAATITNGFTFSVADGGGNGIGNHFHSSTGGDFGNPQGKAEVGNFFSEQVRGLSEYNLAGLASGPAFVTFDLFSLGGLFSGENDFPFTGNINVVAYAGNNAENVSDFQASSVGTVGTFNAAALVVGNTLSFDISSIYNNALTQSLSSLGIRLQIASGTSTGGGAFTFDNFRLTSDNQTTATPEPTPTPTPETETVPEPGTLGAVILSSIMMLRYGKRGQKN